MLQSACMLINGKSSLVVTEFLVEIATDHMGLGVADRKAAAKTVQKS